MPLLYCIHRPPASHWPQLCLLICASSYHPGPSCTAMGNHRVSDTHHFSLLTRLQLLCRGQKPSSCAWLAPMLPILSCLFDVRLLVRRIRNINYSCGKGSPYLLSRPAQLMRIHHHYYYYCRNPPGCSASASSYIRTRLAYLHPTDSKSALSYNPDRLYVCHRAVPSSPPRRPQLYPKPRRHQ